MAAALEDADPVDKAGEAVCEVTASPSSSSCRAARGLLEGLCAGLAWGRDGLTLGTESSCESLDCRGVVWLGLESPLV